MAMPLGKPNAIPYRLSLTGCAPPRSAIVPYDTVQDVGDGGMRMLRHQQEAAPPDAAPTPGETLNILYEDALLLVVDKPTGLVTHPAYKHPDGTLADLVFARQAERKETRPWLLHRLDR